MAADVCKVLAVIVALALFGCGHDEITVYKLECDKPLESGRCYGSAHAYAPNHYKVFPEQQRVVTWIEGGFAPTALDKCVVRDKKNWSCSFSDDSARFDMADGRLRTWVNPDPNINSPAGIESSKREFLTSWSVHLAVELGTSYRNGVVQLLEILTF